jgi:hypothetical protein
VVGRGRQARTDRREADHPRHEGGHGVELAGDPHGFRQCRSRARRSCRVPHAHLNPNRAKNARSRGRRRKVLAVRRPTLTGPRTVDYPQTRHEAPRGARSRRAVRSCPGGRRRPLRVRRNERGRRFERRSLRLGCVRFTGDRRSLFLLLHRSPGQGVRPAGGRYRHGSLNRGRPSEPGSRSWRLPAGPFGPPAVRRPLPATLRAFNPSDLSLGHTRAASAAPGFSYGRAEA